MKNKIKLLILLILILAISCGGYLIAKAEDGTSEIATPTIYANDVETTVGNGVYIYVYGKDFDCISGLDLYIHYDAKIFSYNSYYQGELLSNSVSDVNTSVSGEITLSMISIDGVSGEGCLMYFLLYTKNNIDAGSYNIDVAVGDCYNKTIENISVSASGCKVTVNEAQTSASNIYFYSNFSSATVHKDDSVEISYYTNNSYNFASANFEVNYDKDLLELKSAKPSSNLTSCNGAIYSINTETAGYIKATFAALSGVNTYSTVLTVCFTVIKDTTSTTKIDFSATEIYDSNLVSYIGGTCSNSISIEKIVPTVIVPKVYISDITTTLRSFDVVITAEGTSGIAAGDFLISYNSSKFSCTSITKMFDDAMLTIIKISPIGAIIQ